MGKNCTLDMDGLSKMIEGIRTSAEAEGATKAAASIEPVVKGLYTYVANLIESDYDPEVVAMTLLNLGTTINMQVVGLPDTVMAINVLLHGLKRAAMNPLAEPESLTVGVHG